MHSLTKRIFLGVTLTALLALTGSARAAQAGLKAELIEAAKKIAKAVDGSSVTVGDFTGPKRLQSSAGPGIAKALTNELRKQKVPLLDKAAFTVQGDFLDIVDSDSGRLAVRLNVRIVDRRNRVVLEFARAIFLKDARDTSIQDLLGANVRLPANASDEERDRRLREGLANPNASINGTLISAGKGSPYAVEVLVKDNDELAARQPQLKDGFPFVALQRKEVYAVQLYNNSNFESAVTLSIDGMNVFSFSEQKDETGDARYTQFFLPKKSKAKIKGWHINSQKTAEFVVTDLGASAGGKLKSATQVGTITASFAVAVPKGERLPKDEPAARGADATGIGTQVGTRFSEAERTIGVVRDTISVRYSK